jgi:CheY-like chemotaxis protein
MLPPVLVAGLDARSLVLEASVLRRDGHQVEALASGRELLGALPGSGVRLVVLGPHLPDFTLTELIGRIRQDPSARNVSILTLVPAAEPAEMDAAALLAGANAVLRRPLDTARLDAWVAKLLSVPRRIQARVPVQGQVVGTPREKPSEHFVGLSRNLSVNGMLLASPVRLAERPDVELTMTLPRSTPLHALGRIVRDAPEVAWPYLGYGIEFLYLPDDTLDALVTLVNVETVPPPEPSPDGRYAIHSTLRREGWIYEILEPVSSGDEWQVEIRRAPRESWRPGHGGPYYVVSGVSRAVALETAREFVARHG